MYSKLYPDAIFRGCTKAGCADKGSGTGSFLLVSW